jgi:Xaa-Pro aminopeptidase
MNKPEPNIEKTSSQFNLEKYLDARQKTIRIVNEVASLVYVGMSETDGFSLIDQCMSKYDVEKKWHPNKFRIGENTTKSFREISDEGVRLKSDDIFFIDIGPVFDGHEGDYGRTFVFGKNRKYQDIKEKCELIFNETKETFKNKKLTGIELYQYAEKISLKHGYQLNLKMSGHRLGDFPHAIYFKGSLAEVDVVPCEKLWVLEILIRHPNEEFGAFFEDII